MMRLRFAAGTAVLALAAAGPAAMAQSADPLAAKFYGMMREKGILVSVFTAPAVPRDTSLARFSIHSDTTPADMLRVADARAQAQMESARAAVSAFKALGGGWPVEPVRAAAIGLR